MIIVGVDSTTAPSFAWRNRVARAIWSAAWLLLFRPSPRPLHRWRAMLLRAFGAHIAHDVHVYPSVRIWAPWLLSIGPNVGIGAGATLYNMGGLSIGERCVVSQGAHLCGGSHDIDSSNFQLVVAPIVLSPRVWVCAEAFIGPGVEIAEGTVIGARGVVMKSIKEPWFVWAGNPARQHRRRTAFVHAVEQGKE